MKTHGERLREALAGAERQRVGKGYPRELQRRAGAYGRRRMDGGASTVEVARELGVSRSSLDRWMGHRLEPAMVAVVVESSDEQPEPKRSHGAVVVTQVSSGLRVEGLSFEDVVALLERLK